MLTARRRLAVALTVLAVSGCARERAPAARQSAERPLQLRERVGQKVTVLGRFSLYGKQAPFVLVGENAVYLIAEPSFSWAEPYMSMENRQVSVTGVLRRYEPPSTATPLPDSVQQLPAYFFFDMRDTVISMAK